jgi:hypothetical protein
MFRQFPGGRNPTLVAGREIWREFYSALLIDANAKFDSTDRLAVGEGIDITCSGCCRCCSHLVLHATVERAKKPKKRPFWISRRAVAGVAPWHDATATQGPPSAISPVHSLILEELRVRAVAPTKIADD